MQEQEGLSIYTVKSLNKEYLEDVWTERFVYSPLNKVVQEQGGLSIQ